jgi:phosphoribosylanthranilate isomerase
MSLKTFVKISDVTNLSDARYCAGMGVDVLGFRLDPEDSLSVDPAKFKSITEWVSGVGFVGEFYNSDAEAIIETIGNYNLSYIQINPLSLSKELINLNIPIIVEFCLNNHSSIEGLKDYMEKSHQKVELFLITAQKEEIAERLLSGILELSQEFSILLGCGINKNNVNQLIETSAIKGIAMKGSAEIKPGFKDYDELADILEEIEVE